MSHSSLFLINFLLISSPRKLINDVKGCILRLYYWEYCRQNQIHAIRKFDITVTFETEEANRPRNKKKR